MSRKPFSIFTVSIFCAVGSSRGGHQFRNVFRAATGAAKIIAGAPPTVILTGKGLIHLFGFVMMKTAAFAGSANECPIVSVVVCDAFQGCVCRFRKLSV